MPPTTAQLRQEEDRARALARERAREQTAVNGGVDSRLMMNQSASGLSDKHQLDSAQEEEQAADALRREQAQPSLRESTRQKAAEEGEERSVVSSAVKTSKDRLKKVAKRRILYWILSYFGVWIAMGLVTVVIVIAIYDQWPEMLGEYVLDKTKQIITTPPKGLKEMYSDDMNYY